MKVLEENQKNTYMFSKHVLMLKHKDIGIFNYEKIKNL